MQTSCKDEPLRQLHGTYHVLVIALMISVETYHTELN